MVSQGHAEWTTDPAFHAGQDQTPIDLALFFPDITTLIFRFGWSSSCRSVSTRRAGYLTEEFILRGAQVFDRRRERQSANRRAAKELLSIILATATQLPTSMRTLLKAVNLFREPVHQA